jgi:hypothetical protein
LQQLKRKLVKLARRVRGAVRPPAIDRIFMGAGGSGSSFVVHALRSFGVRVAERPDVMLGPRDVEGLGLPATPAVRTMFNRRSGGFRMDDVRPIEANLVDYLRFLQQRPNQTALFSNLPHFHFFRRHRVGNVVLLVRNPIDAYASFAKPVRHRDVVDQWGGAFTEKSMRRYVDYWIEFVREYVALKEAGLAPGLLRYELLDQDARALGLDAFFPDWRRSRSKVERPEAAAFIRSLVDPEFRQIYPGWDL